MNNTRWCTLFDVNANISGSPVCYFVLCGLIYYRIYWIQYIYGFFKLGCHPAYANCIFVNTADLLLDLVQKRAEHVLDFLHVRIILWLTALVCSLSGAHVWSWRTTALDIISDHMVK